MYGYCPNCNGKVIYRERKFNGGVDRCENGHTFPSINTLNSQKFEKSNLLKEDYTFEMAIEDVEKMNDFGGTGLFPLQERVIFYLKFQNAINRLQERLINIQEKQINEQSEFINEFIINNDVDDNV